jgi:hypothetical protein
MANEPIFTPAWRWPAFWVAVAALVAFVALSVWSESLPSIMGIPAPAVVLLVYLALVGVFGVILRLRKPNA